LEILVQEFEEAFAGEISGRILPVYPTTAGFPQGLLRHLVSAALKDVSCIPDRVPNYLQDKYGLLNIKDALIGIHCPEDFTQLERSQERLVFEELFLHQYYLNKLSQCDKSQLTGIAHREPNTLKKALLHSLKFNLTGDQERVVAEIERDMEQLSPMRRLLQGDVGSGKTLVAILAMLKAVSNGYQAVLMVPTEILAEQHYLYLLTSLKSTEGLRIELLTGNVTGEARKKILCGISKGTVNILVGTQALIQGQIQFNNLGLVVIDEQHRFGVVQRRLLTEFEPTPDVLVMTATPIPRSLELTFYGDLDLSVIREMPPGRKKILTRYVSEKERPKLYKFLKDSLSDGRQAYVVCPLIEESESLEIAAAEDLAEKMAPRSFPSTVSGFCMES
jgi:ATP-dependent DNA helicase RecG